MAKVTTIEVGEQRLIHGMKTVMFYRVKHPHRGSGLCSCCMRSTTAKTIGILSIERGKPTPFYFFCGRCARAIANLVTA
jgi:hypothetical protein